MFLPVSFTNKFTEATLKANPHYCSLLWGVYKEKKTRSWLNSPRFTLFVKSIPCKLYTNFVLFFFLSLFLTYNKTGRSGSAHILREGEVLTKTCHVMRETFLQTPANSLDTLTSFWTHTGEMPFHATPARTFHSPLDEVEVNRNRPKGS